MLARCRRCLLYLCYTSNFPSQSTTRNAAKYALTIWHIFKHVLYLPLFQSTFLPGSYILQQILHTLGAVVFNLVKLEICENSNLTYTQHLVNTWFKMLDMCMQLTRVIPCTLLLTPVGDWSQFIHVLLLIINLLRSAALLLTEESRWQHNWVSVI